MEAILLFKGKNKLEGLGNFAQCRLRLSLLDSLFKETVLAQFFSSFPRGKKSSFIPGIIFGRKSRGEKDNKTKTCARIFFPPSRTISHSDSPQKREIIWKLERETPTWYQSKRWIFFPPKIVWTELLRYTSLTCTGRRIVCGAEKKIFRDFFFSWSRSPKYQRPEKTPQYRTKVLEVFPNIDVKLKSCY